jgi:two-component system nitrate/nitrite sensor histidine kinase NarX
LEIEIRDNGVGFDLLKTMGVEGRHFGLEVMRERIERPGGRFAIDTSPSQGAQLTITIAKARITAS